MPDFTIRPAAAQEADLVLALLTELAAYEKLLSKFSLTQEIIARDFFEDGAPVKCELAFEGDTAVGLVTWYWTYATFAAARGLYVEDLFVRPEWRGKGYGKALLQYLAAKAVAVNATRLEWLVLNWNAPAIEFYKGIGARPLEGWSSYRLEGDAMKKLGDQKKMGRNVSKVTLILAMAENGVIGKDGKIPWHISDDLKRFKALTLGKTVVMGRKTWDSLPKKPLPGRDNVVVTRGRDWRGEGAIVASFDEALKSDAMVIGGAEIYRAALPLATRIELTEVHRAFDGDAVFDFDHSEWREVARERHATPDGLEYSFVTLVR